MPSEKATPDEDGCFGVIKLRGCFPNLRDAHNFGENLIRNNDSLVENHICYVGRDIPLMKDSSIYTKETVEIDLSKTQDEITKSYLRQKKEQERKEREDVEKRHQSMISKDINKDKEESLDTIEYYTKLRTKKAYNMNMIKQCLKTIKEAEDILKRVIPEQEEIDKKHPEFKHQFLAEYEKSLRSINASITDNEMIPIMKEDIESQAKQEQALLSKSPESEVKTDSNDSNDSNDNEQMISIEVDPVTALMNELKHTDLKYNPTV